MAEEIHEGRIPPYGAVIGGHEDTPDEARVIKTGATLVWCLEEPSEADIVKMRPAIDLTQPRAHISDEAVLPSMRHLLAQVDGATIVSPQGMFLGTGAQ